VKTAKFFGIVDSEKNLMSDCIPPGPGNQPGSEEAEWRENAGRLADFVLRNMVNRHDAFGRYRPLEQREQGKCLVERAPLTAELLERHFQGKEEADLVGLHVVDQDRRCRWVALDFDNHAKLDEVAKVNLDDAIAIFRKAESVGLKPLLIDSDGGGGFHLLVVFERPIASVTAFRLAAWLAEGVDCKPESFPKGEKLDPEQLGPWLRLPGRHHTNEHWSRVWNGESWVAGVDAIELIGGHTPADPDAIPRTEIDDLARRKRTDAAFSSQQRLEAGLRAHPVARRLSERRRAEIATFLSRVRHLNESGDGWTASCPAHADSRPSLKIDVNPDGKILAHCHAGCSFDAIVEAVGVDQSFMFDRDRPRGVISHQPAGAFETVPSPANPALAEVHRLSLEAIDQAILQRLSDELGVTSDSLVRLQVGWDEASQSYVFPERNGNREICGLTLRKDGRKRAVRGSKRGLTVPADFRLDSDDLVVCEGASDTAAALTLGHPAIGTPNVGGGFDDLALLLRCVNQGTLIKFVPDNDPAGRALEGTKRLSVRLADHLNRPIEICELPAEFKDLREYCRRRSDR